MSNTLAIATVTEALRGTLAAAVTSVNMAEATIVRPDQAQTTPPCVNIYLYHVAPNAALRNADLPTRDSRGGLVQRPRAALDLFYLLTVHGSDKELEPQRILGIVIRTLHEHPILTAQAIKDAVMNKGELAGSDLLNAVEAVRFTPIPLSLDELSKLWSVFFQAKYALSVAYLASVIFIEGDDEPSSPLPVLTRNVVAYPSFGPVIDRVASRPSGPNTDVSDTRTILAGDVLVLQGRGFSSPNTQLRIGDALVKPTSVTDSTITLDLKKPPLPDVRAGVVALQVVQLDDFGGPTGDHVVFESNIVSFVLAPKITAPVTVAGSTVQLTLDPQVQKDQQLVLALNENAVPAKAFRFRTTAAATGGTQSVPISGVPAGKTYFVRLQVDGAESPLDVDSNGYFTGPTVTP